MLKHAAVLAIVVLAGCEMPEAGVESSPQQAVSSDSPAPSTPAIVGCWVDATRAVTETLSINADGTCSDAVVAQRSETDTCTWAAQDSATIAFVYQTDSPVCSYAIAGDTLTLFCPYMHLPQNYQHTACP